MASTPHFEPYPFSMATMNVSIEIISRETIKPSSPTPLHLQNYQLSFLDQITTPHYTRSILFYESNPNINSSNAEKSNQLKISLSESLTHFYPLAGRHVDSESIHCNDKGVPYIEAHARSSELLKVIHDPNIGELDEFLPCAAHEFYDNVLLAIQVNFFDCGGLAIGGSHKLADATSRMMFLNSWAATLRGQGDAKLNPPIFESAIQFPPRDHSMFSQHRLTEEPVEKGQKEKIVTKIFAFSSSMLEILREKFSDDVNQESPIRATRVEALTAFLSNRHVTAVTKSSKKAPKIFPVYHALNLRGRMEPPLSNFHFGNYATIAHAKISIEEVEEGCCGEFVRKLRGAIKEIDGKYVADNIRESDRYFGVFCEMLAKVGKGDGLNFTSSCRMGAYEVDFGWGKPARIGLTNMSVKNYVRLLDSRDGGGIEAWISMEEEDMAKLEADQDFHSHISPTMSCV